MVCPRGHYFDIARSGYVNLLQPQNRRSKHPGDTPAAVRARRRLHDLGITAPLLRAIAEVTESSAEDLVLDAGCGDGFYLGALAHEGGFTAHGVDISIQAGVWNRLLSLPTPFFRLYSVGDLANRANGIDQIRALLSGSVITTILGTIFSIFSLFLLFTYNAPLAVVAVGLVVIVLAIIIGIELWQLRYQRRLAEYQGRISGLVLQLLPPPPRQQRA